MVNGYFLLKKQTIHLSYISTLYTLSSVFLISIITKHRGVFRNLSRGGLIFFSSGRLITRWSLKSIDLTGPGGGLATIPPLITPLSQSKFLCNICQMNLSLNKNDICRRVFRAGSETFCCQFIHIYFAKKSLNFNLDYYFYKPYTFIIIEIAESNFVKFCLTRFCCNFRWGGELIHIFHSSWLM